MSDPLRQDEHEGSQPSRTQESVKRALRIARSLLIKKLIGVLIASNLNFIIILGLILGIAFFFLGTEEPEPEYGKWEVGGITEFGKNEIPAEYIPIYKKFGEKYDVPWNLLAAHHRVETVFSTIEDMRSPVGAIGHMQFMPLTWLGWSYPGTRLGDAKIPEYILTDPAMIKKYGGSGLDGNGDGKADPWNLEDAVASAAHYLYVNGVNEGNIRKAVYAYNHADWYVDQVLEFADAYVSGYRAIENKPPGENIGGLSWPAPGIKTITSDFGYRRHPVTKERMSFHNGIDFSLPGYDDFGKPIVAFRSGTVIQAGYRGSYGNAVEIDHGDGMRTLYGHMNKVRVSKGDKVDSGSRIGDLGNSGRSTGPHLHFVVKINGTPVDGKKYLKKFLD